MRGTAMMQDQGIRKPRVVVGVYGSGPSKSDLAWAARQAELTGATVEAVTAWHYPVMISRAARALVTANDEAETRAFFVRDLSDSIAEVLNPASQVKVSATVRQGNAVQVRWMPPTTLTCWWSAAGDTAASSKRCSDRSLGTACTTLRAPSS